MPLYQTNAFALMCNINMPSKESELVNFLVPTQGEALVYVCVRVCARICTRARVCVCQPKSCVSFSFHSQE